MNRRSFLAATTAAATVGFLPNAALARQPGLEFVAKKLSHKLQGGANPSPLWVFDTPNGPGMLGDAIRYQLGDYLSVNLTSEIEQGVSIHWHGLRLPNTMDGTEMVQMGVQPGDEAFNYGIELIDPGTHWFHSHQRSWEQVARGLYGMVIVVDPNEPELHDVPLILDDWRLGLMGVQDTATIGNAHDWSHGGRTGPHVTVNGTHQPEIEVPASGWLRLRFLNAATAAFFAPMVAGQPSKIVAYDGFGVEAFEPTGNANLMGPGQRMDVIIDASQIPAEGQAIVQNGQQLAMLKRSSLVLTSPVQSDPSRAFREYSTRGLEPASNAHQNLSLVMTGGAMGQLSGLTLNNRSVSFQELRDANRFWGFNGKADGMQDPGTYDGWEESFFDAFVGETVEIALVNDTRWPHTIHVHGQHFRVLENRALPHEQGRFRDSVNIAPGDTVKIAMKANARGWWPIHCHMLGHQAAGMATWYNII